MAADPGRLDHLMQLRGSVLNEMEEADGEYCALRMRVERIESDIRIGRPEPSEYADLKGHALPQAEGRVLDLYRQLLKLEDKINGVRG